VRVADSKAEQSLDRTHRAILAGLFMGRPTWSAAGVGRGRTVNSSRLPGRDALQLASRLGAHAVLAKPYTARGMVGDPP
jgi:hypothetical protein